MMYYLFWAKDLRDNTSSIFYCVCSGYMISIYPHIIDELFTDIIQ